MERKYSIIGHTGFVGSYLSNVLDPTFKYNSKNIKDIIVDEHDIIICCAPSATKWLVNKNPEEDKNNIDNMIGIISELRGKCKKFILISTIDVYDDLDGSDEDSSISDDNHHYGTNRHYFENKCSDIFGDDLNIIRLCGLYGYGLKKNIIFDFINDKLESININSKFQWYNIEYLGKDIQYSIEQNIKVLNLFSEPIKNTELLELFSEFKDTTNIIKDSGVGVSYDCKTKFSNTGYWLNNETILNDIRSYLDKMVNPSKIIVSNICWSEDIDYKIYDKYGIDSIEVSPSKHFGVNYINEDIEFFDKFKDDNIYSFQSIFFGKNFTIIDNYDEVLSHLKKIIDISEYLSIKSIVFGSPKVRIVNNENDYNTIFKFFKEISEYLNNKCVILCLEPNSKGYGCNFLTNTDETSIFIKKVDSYNIKMVIDTGCMQMENEYILSSIEKHKEIIEHVHFSAPRLTNLFEYKDIINYKLIMKKLEEISYDKKITIEMLNKSKLEIDKNLYLLFSNINILIIGAGWYGCHISKKLIKSGIIPTIVDKKGIFSGSSSLNQNRLHLGFHYPRSYNTRMLCRDNFDSFVDEYGEFLDDVDNNLYLISNKSLLDFKTYLQIMESSGLKFSTIDVNDNLKNIEGGIRCDEKLIKHDSVKSYFKETLSRYVSIKTISNPKELKNEYDLILDMTNNNYGLINNEKKVFYENTISFVYKKIKDSDEVTSYTIMDGKFLSIYPYDIKNNLYTLTDVEFTPFMVSDSIEDLDKFIPTNEWLEKTKANFNNKVIEYLPDFEEKFRYEYFFISKKSKFDFGSDSRELISDSNSNIISYSCGKITGIFECERYLEKIKII